MNSVYCTLPVPQRGLKKRKVTFSYKSGIFWKKVCYKLYSRENFKQRSCKAFTGLSQSVLVGSSHTSTAARSLFAAVQPLPPSPFFCVVPQGSVLGPILLVLYTADLLWLVVKYAVRCTLTTRRYSDPAIH